MRWNNLYMDSPANCFINALYFWIRTKSRINITHGFQHLIFGSKHFVHIINPLNTRCTCHFPHISPGENSSLHWPEQPSCQQQTSPLAWTGLYRQQAIHFQLIHHLQGREDSSMSHRLSPAIQKSTGYKKVGLILQKAAASLRYQTRNNPFFVLKMSQERGEVKRREEGKVGKI